MSWLEPKAKCLSSLVTKTARGAQALSTLDLFRRWNSYPVDDGTYDPFDPQVIFKPHISKIFEMLKNSLSKIRLRLNEGQTLAFKEKEGPWKIYQKRPGFLLPVEFKFLTEGGAQLDTKILIIYDQYFPFNHEHNDENCVPAKDLPLFYQKKGKNLKPGENRR